MLPNDIPSLEFTIKECSANPEFIREYKRLTGAMLGKRSPIEAAIDKATNHNGVNEKEWLDFFDFITKHIWEPVLYQTLELNKEQKQ